jgi:hypothetical protein
MSQVAARHHVGRDVVGDSRRAIESDALTDGIRPGWAWAGFWFPMAGLFLLAVVFVVRRPWFYTVQQEDHLVEWIQFGLCLFSGLVLAAAAIRLVRRGHRGLAALLLLTALGSLVLAGEEISWGQRVLGVVTPDDLAGVNKQAEMNVHNIDAGIPSEDLFKIFAFAMGLGGAALAWFTRRSRSPLNRTDWWLVAPPLLTVPGFAGMALYRAFILFLPLNPAVRAQEWVEVGLYGGLAVTAGCCYARATADRYQLDLTDDQRPVRRLDPQVSVNPVPLVWIGVGVLLLTVVFAILTTQTDVLPGNI